jgi:hypothetical protein
MPESKIAPLTAEKNDHVLSRKEVIEKYGDVSPFTVVKIDVQRRGVVYSENAIKAADPKIHDVRKRIDEKTKKMTHIPASLLLRDGSTVMAGMRAAAVSPSGKEPYFHANNARSSEGGTEPYYVDVRDGRLVLVDAGEIVDEVEFWPVAEFKDKCTSAGTPMGEIAVARPQRIDFDPYRYCHFWDNGHGCLYCSRGGGYYKNRNEAVISVSSQDAYETLHEALKQKGRYTSVHLTGGSHMSGKELFDDEVDRYIEFIQALGKNFTSPRFPSQLIASAFSEKQLAKIYTNTGIATYTADLEVLDPEKFAWICPGKNEWVGYAEWKRRLIAAVDIFGPGNVNTGTVGGVELAKPKGFPTEDDALKSNLEEVEDLARHGVSVVYIVWGIGPNSAFANQKLPSLEYFVRLAKGYHEIHQRYGFTTDNDTYRNCGNHPDTDLDRVRA